MARETLRELVEAIPRENLRDLEGSNLTQGTMAIHREGVLLSSEEFLELVLLPSMEIRTESGLLREVNLRVKSAEAKEEE